MKLSEALDIAHELLAELVSITVRQLIFNLNNFIAYYSPK